MKRSIFTQPPESVSKPLSWVESLTRQKTGSQWRFSFYSLSSLVFWFVGRRGPGQWSVRVDPIKRVLPEVGVWHRRGSRPVSGQESRCRTSRTTGWNPFYNHYLYNLPRHPWSKVGPHGTVWSLSAFDGRHQCQRQNHAGLTDVFDTWVTSTRRRGGRLAYFHTECVWVSSTNKDKACPSDVLTPRPRGVVEKVSVISVDTSPEVTD